MIALFERFPIIESAFGEQGREEEQISFNRRLIGKYVMEVVLYVSISNEMRRNRKLCSRKLEILFI